MGQAKQRGSQDERIQEARERKFEKAEVLIALNAEEGKLDISIMPRDAAPNQDSPALIFAGFINANFEQLVGEAWQLYLSHNAAERGEVPMAGARDEMGYATQATPDDPLGLGDNRVKFFDQPVRSIITAEGDVARVDEVKLLGPDGGRLQ